MNLVARDYQLESVDSAWKQLQSSRSALVVLPTGTGKTLVFVKLAERWFKKKKQRVVVVCPSRELVAGAEKCFRENTKLRVGVDMAERHANGEPIVIATMQTLRARLNKYDRSDIGLVVFDEADLALAPSYEKIAGYFDGAKVFGCTATPERSDGKPLAKMFETLAFKRDIIESIGAGHIVPFRRRRIEIAKVHRDRSVDDSLRVKMRGGDFDPSWLDSIFTQERSLHEVVKPTHELATGRQTIVFGTSVLHAQLLAALFNRYWPGSARAISGKSKDRKEILESFRRREFQFLCNCILINRGVDLLTVSCVAMARPTTSRTLYIQMLGRGSRISDGKDDCLVIDFTFNSDVHSMSVVDVLSESREIAIRSTEILDCNPELTVTDAIRTAVDDLASNKEIRDRVRAIVEFESRPAGYIDWRNVDWSKTNREIARILGTDHSTVSDHRPLTMPSPAGDKHRPKSIDWSAVDWASTYKQIARNLVISPVTASRHDPRKTENRRRMARPKIDWSHVDWTKRNYEIGKELGVGSYVVCRRRKRRNKFIESRKYQTVDWSMSNKEIGALIGSHFKDVAIARQFFGGG